MSINNRAKSLFIKPFKQFIKDVVNTEENIECSEEYKNKDIYFSLSHDILLKPLLEHYKTLKKDRKKVTGINKVEHYLNIYNDVNPENIKLICHELSLTIRINDTKYGNKYLEYKSPKRKSDKRFKFNDNDVGYEFPKIIKTININNKKIGVDCDTFFCELYYPTKFEGDDEFKKNYMKNWTD